MPDQSNRATAGPTFLTLLRKNRNRKSVHGIAQFKGDTVMSASPASTQPTRRFATGIPERVHNQHDRSFHIQMDADELVELLEWAAHGAYALGWLDLCNFYDNRQMAMLRRLQHMQRPVYLSHAE
ncbi:hypothetical protein [Paeniroseomonas aquatica]